MKSRQSFEKLARDCLKHCGAKRIAASAGVALAAAVEYIAKEILLDSGNFVNDDKKARINPRFIMRAIRYDKDIDGLFPKTKATFATGGVVPNLNEALLPNKGNKSKSM